MAESAQISDEALLDNLKQTYGDNFQDMLMSSADGNFGNFVQTDTFGDQDPVDVHTTAPQKEIQEAVGEMIYKFLMDVCSENAESDSTKLAQIQPERDRSFRKILTICSILHMSGSFKDLPHVVVNSFYELLRVVKPYSFLLNCHYFDADVTSTQVVPAWISTGRSILGFFKTASLQKVLHLRVHVGIIIEVLLSQLLTSHENIELGSNVEAAGYWPVNPDGTLEKAPPLNLLTSVDALIERFLIAEFAAVNRLTTYNQKISDWCRNALFRFMMANNITPIGFGDANTAPIDNLSLQSVAPVEAPKKSYIALQGMDSVLKPLPQETPKPKPKDNKPKPAEPLAVEPTKVVEQVASVSVEVPATIDAPEPIEPKNPEESTKPAPAPSKKTKTKRDSIEVARSISLLPAPVQSDEGEIDVVQIGMPAKPTSVTVAAPKDTKPKAVKRPAETKDGEGPPVKKQKTLPNPPAVQLIVAYMIEHVPGCEESVSLKDFTTFVSSDALLKSTYSSLTPEEMKKRFSNATRTWGNQGEQQNRYFVKCPSDEPDAPTRYMPDKSTPEHQARWEQLKKFANEKWETIKQSKKA